MVKTKVLVVEDDGSVAAGIAICLDKLGYDVSSIVTTGEDAIKKAREESPDVVLMDIMLSSQMDGIEAGTIIKEELDIPVIFLTAHGEDQLIEKAKGIEPSGYIMKPFHEREIKASIEIGLYKKEMERRLQQSEMKYRMFMEKTHNELEQRVKDRTAELLEANEQLKQEIRERKRIEEALRQSEERYRTILESIEEGYYEVDLAGNLTFVNESLCRLHGSPKEELLGMNNREYMDPETAKRIYQIFNEVYKTGNSEKITDYTITRKEGSKQHSESSVSLMKDSEGRPIGFRGIARDVTERKLAEEQILIANERLQYLLSATSAVIYTAKTSDDYGATFISQNVTQMVGYEPYQFIEDSNFWINHIHSEDIPYISEEVSRVFEQEFHAYECRFKHKNGSYVWVRDEMKLVRDENGNPLEIIGFWMDITDRKQAEEALLESEERYRTLFESSRDAIMTLAPPTWLFTSGNPATVELFRVRDEAEFISLGPWQLSPERQPDDKSSAEKAMEMIETAMRNGSHFFEWTHCHSDGTPFPAEVLLTRMEQRGHLLLQATVRDITERKQAEEEIKASLKEKEVLLSEIHHRVKNNMQVIISLLRLQADKVEDKKYADMFKEGEDRIRSMSLIHEQLYQSKDFANINFGEYVKSLTNGLFTSHGVDTNKVKLNIEIEDVLFDLENAIPCGLIINELVSNSLKHAFPDERKGKIEISLLATNEDELELTVNDNGIGMPEGLDIEQADTMGLQLVKVLAEHQLDGKITLNRTQGTQFHIKLKRAAYKPRI